MCLLIVSTENSKNHIGITKTKILERTYSLSLFLPSENTIHFMY